MAMTDRTDDERRWAEAEGMAAGLDDPARRRVRRNRVFLFLVVVILVGWAVGIIAVLAIPHSARAGNDDDLTDARVYVALAIEAVGLVVMIGGFAWAVRTGRYLVKWRSIASPLSRRQRREAQRAIAGKVVLQPDRTPFLLALAAQNRRTTEGITPIYGGLILVDSVSMLLHPSLVSTVFLVVVAVLFLFVAVQLVLVYRRSGRFLAAHGEE